MRSSSAEGYANVLAELDVDADPRRVVERIQSRVDGLGNLPADVGTPVVQELFDDSVLLSIAIFGFVGAFGEVAVPLILGGTGYQLLGNAITSALNVLNYPLAAAISSVATLLMLALIVAWYRLFDIRLLLGKIVGRQ